MIAPAITTIQFRQNILCQLLPQLNTPLVERIVRFDRREKIAGNQPRSLMDELVERMLSVGSRFTPNHRAGCIIHRLAIARRAFSVALHVPLLEVCGEASHVLIVWKYRMCL